MVYEGVIDRVEFSQAFSNSKLAPPGLKPDKTPHIPMVEKPPTGLSRAEKIKGLARHQDVEPEPPHNIPMPTKQQRLPSQVALSSESSQNMTTAELVALAFVNSWEALQQAKSSGKLRHSS